MSKWPAFRTADHASMGGAAGQSTPILHPSIRRRGCNVADRDLAQQLDAIAETLTRHASVLNELLPDTTACNAGAAPPGHCALFDVDVVAKRKLGARRAGESQVVSELEKAEQLGVVRSLATAPALAALHVLQT